MTVKTWVDSAMPYSKSGHERLTATAMACLQVDQDRVEGDFVECGVWRGGNVMVARWASPSRRCWLYDTFSGMTVPGKYDTNRKGIVADPIRWPGKSAVSLTDVMDNLIKVGVWDLEKIKPVVGDVRQSLLVPEAVPEKIAVLRLDTDFYDSTKVEMEVLYPRLQVGGYLLVDDYGHWLGARKAVEQYLGPKVTARLTPIDYTGVWMRKQEV